MSMLSVNQSNQSAIYSAQLDQRSPPPKPNENSFSFMMNDTFLQQKREGMEKIVEKVESDKDFAKEMVEQYRSTPDRVLFNLQEAFSSPGGLSYIQSVTNDFNMKAEQVSAQREELYRSLSSRNYSDADIFKSFLDFNNSLPDDYKQAAGIVKVDTTA